MKRGSRTLTGLLPIIKVSEIKPFFLFDGSSYKMWAILTADYCLHRPTQHYRDDIRLIVIKTVKGWRCIHIYEGNLHPLAVNIANFDWVVNIKPLP